MAAIAALCLSAAQAKSSVCKGPDGRTVIQEAPCADARPPTVPAASPCQLTAAARRDAERLDWAFVSRYADEPKHRRAHVAELEAVVSGLRPMNARLQALLHDRKKIDDEREFFKDKPMPPRLRAEHEANIAQLAGLTLAFHERRESIARIDSVYRCQRATYGKLWSGAPIGSSACDRPACSLN